MVSPFFHRHVFFLILEIRIIRGIHTIGMVPYILESRIQTNLSSGSRINKLL